MIDEPEVTTDFLVVGKDEIHVMSMDNMSICADKVAQSFRALGLPDYE